MTRHERFDVRVSPDVARAISEVAHDAGGSVDEVRPIHTALDRLGQTGTRAAGAKKLRSLDVWEIRAVRFRLFFCLVPGMRVLAVGAMVAKSTRRIRMARLKRIERHAHAWRKELEQDR